MLITVLLGFTKDSYPLTRKAALDDLACLSKVVAVEDQSLVQCCYFRATELLFDAEDSVRCSAVRAVFNSSSLLTLMINLIQKRFDHGYSSKIVYIDM